MIYSDRMVYHPDDVSHPMESYLDMYGIPKDRTKPLLESRGNGFLKDDISAVFYFQPFLL